MTPQLLRQVLQVVPRPPASSPSARLPRMLAMPLTVFCALVQSVECVKVDSFFIAKHSRMAPAAKGLLSILTSTARVMMMMMTQR